MVRHLCELRDCVIKRGKNEETLEDRCDVQLRSRL